MVTGFITILTTLIYTAIRDNQDFKIALQLRENQSARERLPNEKTFQELLEEAGYSSEEIKNHPKLGFFYDPVTLSITQNPAITNTDNILDELTATQLIKNNLRLFTQNSVSHFTGAPPLKNLLNKLVDEAVAEKKRKLTS